MIDDGVVTPVKGGVKAGHLGEVWETPTDGADRREIVGLVERRKGYVTFENAEHGVID